MTGPESEAAPSEATPGGVLTRRSGPAFEVHLDVFSGPFDLLLGLISKHKLDITEISLGAVTDEFIAHIRTMRESDPDWDLSVASEFLLVAATLLDLKAARLLPSPGEDDEEDLALIEARDLLFARLLQYRAYKQVAAWMSGRMEKQGRAQPRRAGVDPRFAKLLPELVLGITPEQLAAIAAEALTPKPPPTVGVEHLHAPVVSVAEQGRHIAAILRRDRAVSFRSLIADAGSTPVVVARFLSLLELFRVGTVGFDQAEALGELTVRWTASDADDSWLPPAWVDRGDDGGDDDGAAGSEFDDAAGRRLHAVPATDDAMQEGA